MFERFLPHRGPVDLPASRNEPNPIHRVLDAHGFPYRVPVSDVIARYGVTMDPDYRHEKSFMTPCPFGLEGLIRPFWPQMTPVAHRDLMPLWFSAMIWRSHDVMDNLKAARDQFARYFGSTEIGKTASNTLGCGWRAGPASLTLTVFPPTWQSPGLSNHAHESDPRLATACSVSLQPGYRRPLDAQELAWLETARPIAAVAGQSAASLEALWANWPSGSGRDFIREPVAACTPLLGQIALSQNEQAVIVCSRQLFVLPRARIEGLALQNILPAKGGGGAVLSFAYRGPGGDARAMAVSEVFGREERLEPLAERLGAALGLNVRVMPEEYDC